MNSTSFFHVLSAPMPGPTMPVDVAMQLYIASSPPLRSFLSSYEDCRAASRNLANAQRSHCYKPLRPCLSSRRRSGDDDLDRLDLEPPCLAGWQSDNSPTKVAAKDKKRVVFADSKGMSLTAVHLFSSGGNAMMDDPAAEVTQALSRLQLELENATRAITTAAAPPASQSLTLDFPQPSADYLDFRSRLLRNQVCLENCTLQERSLTGTVKVRNLAFEKSVQLRVTFDSWRSLRDVDCTFMNNVYGCQETDTFAFAVELPCYVAPANRVEFCVCYRAADQTYWDNNDGDNYRLVAAAPWQSSHESKWSPTSNKKKETSTSILTNKNNNNNNSNAAAGPKKPIRKLGAQLGSPSRITTGFFPGWQTWDCIENSNPYW
ncbi:protein phosphatase 1, regulatory subunit 3Ca [Engraulis encrasicolus]|uniref:protein phosphatase 1, regulatory subunit 3Ca n=1 Tax=Engraulis encrasicolus TaxID=184585 RepID=UPI002FD609B1